MCKQHLPPSAYAPAHTPVCPLPTHPCTPTRTPKQLLVAASIFIYRFCKMAFRVIWHSAPMLLSTELLV